MSTKIYSAAQVHDGCKFLPAGTGVELDEAGVVTALHADTSGLKVERLEGTICPGFVNAHCHLELSHLSGLIPEKTGLIPFLQAVTGIRAHADESQKKDARFAALRAMNQVGIVAVGDIANTTDTLDLRASDQMHFHTFVECIGFTEHGAGSRFEQGATIWKTLQKQTVRTHSLTSSLVPHAPYSVSEKLFRMIDAAQPDALLSIHNQECVAENEFFNSASGAVIDLLNGFGIDHSSFQASGKSSLQTYLPWLSKEHPIIFVHNTFTERADIQFAKQHCRSAFWCLCPNANRYIEQALPNVPMLASETENICIGTDSLASNHQLSIFAELQTLKQAFPELSWETLLRWACHEGARALQLEGTIGRLEVGKRPGLVWLPSWEERTIPQRIA
ncbi:MAG: amidohydrolase family protein [Bacteroidetes bacterium]|nr:amidohydrolase family protein [Bacteroidota bacterium]